MNKEIKRTYQPCPESVTLRHLADACRYAAAAVLQSTNKTNRCISDFYKDFKMQIFSVVITTCVTLMWLLTHG